MRRVLFVVFCLLLAACGTGITAPAPASPLPLADALHTAMPARSTVTVADALRAVLTVAAQTPGPIAPATPPSVAEMILTAMPPGSSVTMLDVIRAMQTVMPAGTPTPRP